MVRDALLSPIVIVLLWIMLAGPDKVGMSLRTFYCTLTTGQELCP